MTKKRILIVVVVLFVGAGLILTYHYYTKIFGANVVKEGSLYIPTSSDFEQVEHLITPFLNRSDAFRWVAEKKKYPKFIKPGKYLLKKGMNNNELVNLLRSGMQTPVKLTFNNQGSLEKLAGCIARQIEPDSLELLQVLNDTAFLHKNNFNKATAISMYIPNSYEFYWNTDARNFQTRMLKEYHKFWNASRLDRAKKLGLTPAEVMTLASIVQKETATVSERKTVAGLYLNRWRNKWPLQADPTIIFAYKQKYGEDTEIKRVYFKYLTIDSPYNTYVYTGIPPGPIGMPDISSIDAVLYPENHDYYYMCASVTDIGKHVFAKTLAQHRVNARKYRIWVAEQGY